LFSSTKEVAMADSTQTVGLHPGTRIGKYLVVERLAIGGQAIVYKCHDPLLDRHVAIKQISSHLAEDKRFLERFRREAQILARLGAEQAAIVTIHELIEDERGLFIVMEYIPGNTLETVLSLNPDPVEPKAVLQVIWRLAAGLHAVHAAGIIHRDIKPANIIIGEGLKAKITDFGVAASSSGQTSMVLGTTKYMAPEVFAGKTPDARMDMYSLGFIAYEMLLGRAKFNEVFADVVRDKHSEAQRWMKWHGNDVVQAPALHEVSQAVPLPLSNIVARMMAKNPDQRFASMEELGKAIKTSFSPRAKAAAGAAAAAAAAKGNQVPAALRPPPGPARSGVFRAISTTNQGRDEADELEVTQPPATAALPKKKMKLQTKLIVAALGVGLVVAALLGYMALDYSRAKDEKDRLQQIFKAGTGFFQRGEYAEAVKRFEPVRKSGYKEAGAPQASVLIEIAKANLSMELALAAKSKDEKDKHWAASAEAEVEAERALTRVQAANSDLYEWTKQMRDELSKFGRTRDASRKFDEAVSAASVELAAGRYQQALETLNEKLRDVVSLTRAQEDQVRDMRRTIVLATLKGQVEARIAEGVAAASAKDYDKAVAAFDEAERLLSGPEVEMLPGAEHQAFRNQINAGRAGLKGERQYAAAITAADEARAAGDRDKEISALREADGLRPSPELKGRIRDARAAKALDAARAAKAANKISEARGAYRESLAIKPDKQVEEELAQLDKAVARQQLVQQGDADDAAGNFAQALAKYEQAQGMSADADVGAKISGVKFKLAMAEGDSLRDQRKYREAVDAYERARLLNPAAAADIDAREAAIARVQKYDDTVKEGDRFFAAKQWTKAREAYQRAQKINGTAEVKSRIDMTYYSENVELGRSAMGQGNPESALAYFRIAQKYADTEEVRKLIEEAQKAVESKNK
jgi:serine/threonine-protein kinase